MLCNQCPFWRKRSQAHYTGKCEVTGWELFGNRMCMCDKKRLRRIKENKLRLDTLSKG